MTAIATQTINLDLRPHFNRQNNCIVYCSQYDNDLRNVVVNIADAGTAVNVSTYTIYIEGTKPDKKGFSYELTDIGGTVSNNVVTFPLQLQMTACAGITNAELVFYSGDDRVGSSNFILAVEKAGLADDIDVSETDIPAYVDGAQQAAADAEDAKDLAVSAAETAQGVLESIPEDYSDLSNDVDDLKNAFEQLPTSIQPDMSVGNVFSDDSYTEDKTPYLYRVSGGGVEVGKVEADTIVGGTIAWNQLVQNGNFADASGWSSGSGSLSISDGVATVTLTGQAWNNDVRRSYPNLPLGHKMLWIVEYKCSENISNELILRSPANTYGTAPYTTNWSTVSGIKNIVGTDTTNIIIFGYVSNMSSYTGEGFSVRKIQIFDLTQMFGSAVADYLYSLETATAGAGVAWFKKLFPKPYYPYNAGELLSVSGLQSHDMVGFNAWDEEWELGGIDTSTGQNVSGSDRIRAKNYIPILPSTNYYFYNGSGSTYSLRYYDADKNYIGLTAGVTASAQYSTPSNAYYVRFIVARTTYNHDICINLSWDGQRNGEYEPYEVHSYPLDSSLTLRGIPKLDASDNLYYDGDVYSADGKVQRKYRIITLNGTENWTYSNSVGRGFYIPLNSLAKLRDYSHSIVCDRLTVTSVNYAEAFTSGQYMVSGYLDNNAQYPNQNWLYIKTTDDVTSATALKSWLASNPVTVVYELATPTEETAEPYTEYQKVSKYGTEEYVSTGIVPVGHITKYPTDIVSKVDGLPSDFSTLIAPTEKGFTATRAYTVNDLLIVNNTLYKVTANIANGATITVGTNVQQTTLSALIKALSA